MTALAGGRSIEQAEAYVFAVGVLRDTVLELKAIGIAPTERCDALGHQLMDLLPHHYPKEQALLWAEDFPAMFKRC